MEINEDDFDIVEVERNDCFGNYLYGEDSCVICKDCNICKETTFDMDEYLPYDEDEREDKTRTIFTIG